MPCHSHKRPKLFAFALLFLAALEDGIADEKSFLEEHKKNIIDLLLHGIVRTGEKER